jgi:hypothetical protein
VQAITFNIYNQIKELFLKKTIKKGKKTIKELFVIVYKNIVKMNLKKIFILNQVTLNV